MSSQLFANEISSRQADDLAAHPTYGIGQCIYLAASGAATIGWFWLIAWAAIRVTA
jgi:hypothetical protein